MKKKTIGKLLIISWVMIMCIAAVSAADTNDTLQEKVSYTSSSTSSSASAQEDNAHSLYASDGKDVEEISVDDNQDEIPKPKTGNTSSNSKDVLHASYSKDVEEISVDDNQDEISNQKMRDTSSNSKDVLSASDSKDVLRGNDFLYGGRWYSSFEDAIDAAEDDGGILYIRSGTYTVYGYTIDVGGTNKLTITPYEEGGRVIFDANEEDWIFNFNGNSDEITFNYITFKNGKGGDGAAIDLDGTLYLNHCEFYSNHATSQGGAIYADDNTKVIAYDCVFIGNHADSNGGAIYNDVAEVTLKNCRFSGNYKGSGTPNDFEDFNDKSEWTFENCLFDGEGSIEYEVDYLSKSVTVIPYVSDDINFAVLYNGTQEYRKEPCSNGYPTYFYNLDPGTYTIYLMKGEEKRYYYNTPSFTIIEPNFVLDDTRVFETLSGAVGAISDNEAHNITVEDGNYTDSANFNVQILNKIVTIRPKDSSIIGVIFSANSANYLLHITGNSKLTMEDIIITGKYSDSALKFSAKF